MAGYSETALSKLVVRKELRRDARRRPLVVAKVSRAQDVENES